MSDPIERQDAIDALDCINGVEEVLRSLPSAQRKKGRWISQYNGKPVKVINGIPRESCNCSVCGAWLTASDEYGVIGNYCPNCGAMMVDDDIS